MILLADQKVFPIPPPVEEAVHIAFRQPIPLPRLGGLPQSVLMLLEGQPGQRDGPAAAVAQSEAELDVGDAVEPKPRIEPVDRDRISAPEGHAVTLDGVNLRTLGGFELFHGAAGAKAKRAGHHHRGIRECLEQRRDRVAFQLDPGIEEDDLPYVFDRFYRSPAARKLPGSGLGLAIVKQVAEAHGGGVGAERAEGGGTLMRLRLSGSNGAGPA